MTVAEAGLEEARKARRSAAERLAVTTSEVTIPLRNLHKENHIGPLLDGLIQKKAERTYRT
ncbi:MAG TPA: hypothetical protein VHE33_10485 [Acidobacteriaceae bacterium]|nr:hypothetical protein [Acidobacteriaceae bacterium]